MDPDELADGTALTGRQAEVLALRREGLTQTAIADRLGTTVANVSAIESAGRTHLQRARRTLIAAYRLAAADWFTAEPGTHLRELVEDVYAHGDAADVKVTFSHPELSAFLHVQFQDQLDGRRLTTPVSLGITPAGAVLTEPPAADAP